MRQMNKLLFVCTSELQAGENGNPLTCEGRKKVEVRGQYEQRQGSRKERGKFRDE